jgi:hypothetical protein
MLDSAHFASGGRESMQLQTLKPIEFSDYLLECKALDEAQLLDALADQWQNRTQLAEAIVRRGYLPKDEIERLFAEYENLNVVYV